MKLLQTLIVCELTWSVLATFEHLNCDAEQTVEEACEQISLATYKQGLYSTKWRINARTYWNEVFHNPSFEIERESDDTPPLVLSDFIAYFDCDSSSKTYGELFLKWASYDTNKTLFYSTWWLKKTRLRLRTTGNNVLIEKRWNQKHHYCGQVGPNGMTFKIFNYDEYTWLLLFCHTHEDGYHDNINEILGKKAIMLQFVWTDFFDDRPSQAYKLIQSQIYQVSAIDLHKNYENLYMKHNKSKPIQCSLDQINSSLSTAATKFNWWNDNTKSIVKWAAGVFILILTSVLIVTIVYKAIQASKKKHARTADCRKAWQN